MILAGDIGGTNSRMAFFEGDPNHPQLKVLEVFPSKGRAGLEEILQEFIAKHPHAVAAAAFGIAGPVRNGRCETPNLPWIVDSASLAACLGLKSASLLNDLRPRHSRNRGSGRRRSGDPQLGCARRGR